jgi:N-methylhydantoinase B/oxoprolinase/acetone carboxylase alpha subunit
MMADWKELVRFGGQSALNDQAVIIDCIGEDDTYHIEVTGGGGFQARTQRGVDVMLQELEVVNDGWHVEVKK